MVFLHSGARDFDLGGGLEHSGNYPMVFLHSGARDFDLGGGLQHSGNYPMVFDELGVGGLIERIKNRQHHELAVRQGLGRRIYRDTARWPLYLERNVPLYRYRRTRPPNQLTRPDLGGSCMKLPHLGRFGARRSGVSLRVTSKRGWESSGVV